MNNREPTRTGLRVAVSLLVSLAVANAIWQQIGTTLHGTSIVVGYPLFANFNVTRYTYAYYLAILVGPAVFLVCFQLLSRFGPLRRLTAKRRSVRDGQTPDGDEFAQADKQSVSPAMHISRLVGVGAMLGLEIKTGFGLGSISPVLAIALGAVIFASAALLIAAALHQLRPLVQWTTVTSVFNIVSTIVMVPLLYQISRTTIVTVLSTDRVVHYPWLPLWLVIGITALLLAWAVRFRIRHELSHIEHHLIFFVAVPLTIFIIHAGIPGALGPVDVFGEGEYLAGGWLLLHGVMPWRDIYMIHGIWDDGIKSIIGYQIFGRTRWGATTGITMLLYPLYWVFLYYFAAAVFIRRSFFVLAVAASMCAGIFVNWDLRYAFWPLILILLARALQQRNTGGAIALMAGIIAQAILIPEMSYALIACGATAVLFEIYERRSQRFSFGDYPVTIRATISGAVMGGAFLLWLHIEHALGGFVGYFKDFATSHALTGGIPLFTDYAKRSVPNSLGITLHAVDSPALITRYSIELFLPIAAIVVTILLVVARIRGGRRLVIQDWLCVAAAIMVALYYPKGIDRADVGHIAEVFEVTVPLLLLLSYRFVVGLDRAFAHQSVAGVAKKGSIQLRRHISSLSVASPAAMIVLLVVLLSAPLTPTGAVMTVPTQHQASSPTPAAPPMVKGGPGLGYATNGLSNDVIIDTQRIFDRYAGTSGPVFDFSSAPAIVNFFLDRRPTSRFYDMGSVLTPTTEYQVISDLQRTQPNIVLFDGAGLSSWDYISNQVREGILSDYLLTNYRPLVLASGELFLIKDSILHPKALPPLLGRVRTTVVALRSTACAWGFIPDFLKTPNMPSIPPPIGATKVGFHLIGHDDNGAIYQLDRQARLSDYHWISVTIAGSTGPVGLTISNVEGESGRDISWATQKSGTTQVEVASCIQWHGFGHTLFLRYVGTGKPKSISLIS